MNVRRAKIVAGALAVSAAAIGVVVALMYGVNHKVTVTDGSGANLTNETAANGEIFGQHIVNTT